MYSICTNVWTYVRTCMFAEADTGKERYRGGRTGEKLGVRGNNTPTTAENSNRGLLPSKVRVPTNNES